MKDNAMPPGLISNCSPGWKKDYDLGYDAQTEDRYYAVDKNPASWPAQPSTNSELYRELQLASRWTGTRCRRKNAT